MILTRYNKIGDMGFVSHRDTLKVLQRGLKRMKVDVKYSQGYVPHMRTYISSPLPLGVLSNAEYFVVDCDNISAEEYNKRFLECMPKGLKPEYSIEIEKNPNLPAIVVASEYKIKVLSNNADKALDILNKNSYMISTYKKGEAVIKEARNLIYSIDVKDGIITTVLATGNENLRVDSFIDSLRENYEIIANKYDCIRTNQLVYKDDKLVTVEEFLNK